MKFLVTLKRWLALYLLQSLFIFLFSSLTALYFYRERFGKEFILIALAALYISLQLQLVNAVIVIFRKFPFWLPALFLAIGFIIYSLYRHSILYDVCIYTGWVLSDLIACWYIFRKTAPPGD